MKDQEYKVIDVDQPFSGKESEFKDRPGRFKIIPKEVSEWIRNNNTNSRVNNNKIGGGWKQK